MSWSVVCLCAEWCNVCQSYKVIFEQVAKQNPQDTFLWVDVEDESDLMADLEIATFPTLLIANGNWAQFMAPLAPYDTVLRQILQSLKNQSDAASPCNAEAQALLERIHAHF